MSEAKDPERLLADALRAQAVFAPQTTPITDQAIAGQATTPVARPSGDTAGTPSGDTAGTTDSMPPQYGLLSGAGADSLERERAALEPVTVDMSPPTVRTQAPATSTPLPVLWVLVLAVLLGLAAGSIIGLLTLL